jgi:hypothetical protein
MRMRKPSPAMLVAIIALLVALGGSSYAALKLPKGSVGPRQLKKNAVTSPKVKPGSLRLSDFRKADRTSLRGPQGIQGSQGIQGVQGPEGPFPSGDLPSGKTIRGTYAIAVPTGSTNFIATSISFGFQLASAPIAHVIADGGAPPPECPGSVTNPQAQAGHLCVYESFQHNRSNLRVFNPATGGSTATRWGAGVAFDAIAGVDPTESTTSYGTWAVTSP